jgi:hypothetical protein
MHALGLGVALGLVTEVLRKVLRRLDGYQRFIKSGRLGWTVDFTVDAILLPSPYASSFGGFVELNTMYWWAGGGVFASLYEWAVPKFSSAAAPATGELPADMSTMSLVGGGLIAGESLAALAFGLVALAQNLF